MTGHAWTSEMTRALMIWHGEGVPFTELAARLSAQFGVTLTKNACIGRARRMGLPVRGPTNMERTLKQPRPKMIRVPRKVDAPIDPEPEPEVEALPGVSIYQLTGTTCRWPLGSIMDRPPLRYCGCRCDVEVPYCKEHTITSRGSSYGPRKVAVY
jgi:GcrA cell cycle regulator